MRTGFFSILFISLSVALSAQTTSLFDLYEIPTYSYNRLSLSGQDFFGYNKSINLDQHTSNESALAHFILNDKYVNQSLMSTNSITSYLIYDYYKSETEWPEYNSWAEGSQVDIQIQSFNNWYINNPKGLFVFTNPGIYYLYDFRKEYNRNSMGVQAGAGYGRITGMRSIVQAYIIADELELSLSNDIMVKMAGLIDKYYDGFYYARYRDDENIEFYKDIAKLTGRPDDAFHVQQILTSGLYKTTERFKGYEFKLGTNVWYMNAPEYYYAFLFPDNSVSTDIFVSAEIAMPVSFTTQVNASLTYTKNTDKKLFRVPSLSASAGISFMHNYNWKTELAASYQRIFPDEEAWQNEERLDDRDMIELRLRSEAAIINTLSIYAELAYNNSDFSNDSIFNGLNYSALKNERTNFRLGFNYYIL